MRASGKQFVVCLKNKGYEVSLERRKIYQVLPDPEAAKHRQVRVIDESGEDYLYPQAFFAPQIVEFRKIHNLVQLVARACELSDMPGWNDMSFACL